MKSVLKFIGIALLLIGFQSTALAAVWSISPWTDDESTGIDSSKTYTHVINNTSSSETVTVNGVEFTNTSSSGSEEEGWTLSGGLWAYEGSVNMTGDSAALALDVYFHYYVSELVLYGLTPNAVYELTFFSVAWEDGTRDLTLADEYGSFDFNQDEYGNDNGIMITAIYTADENGELHMDLDVDFHIYAFVNCEYTGDLPVIVSAVSPDDFEGGNRVETDVDLVWAEQFAGSLTNPGFDVYFDPNESKVTEMDPAVLVSSKQSAFSYTLSLDPNALYYWRVATYLDVNDTEPNQVTDVRGLRTVYEDEHWTDASWTTDADSGISAGKVYTHKVNFNTGEAASTYVNGVYFENDSDREGSNWTLDGATSGGSLTSSIDGDGAALVANLFYGSDAVLTLTDLTPGQDYILTKYTQGYGDPGERLVHFITSADNRTTTLDGNIDGKTYGHLFQYAYTAPESGELVITFDPLSSADTWHHYAFSNEVYTSIYVDPTPAPEASVDYDVELSWVLNGDVTNPSYHLTVATDEAMSNLVVDQTMTATAYTPYLSSDTTYYWQIEVIEDGSETVHTSPVWSFDTTPPQDADMVIEWKFDETTGTVAEQTGPSDDADGILVNFNDPNTPGVCHVAGLINNGLRLNGRDEYVDVSHADEYMPTADGQSFAISGYLCTFDHYGPLFSMRNSDDENPIINIALGEDGRMGEDKDGKICLLVRDDKGSISYANSDFTVNDGLWHNFIVTRVDGIWTLYIDGVSCAVINGAATGEVTLDMMAIGTSLRWIADDWQPGYTYYRDFQGILDEYTIWDGELQPDQIAELAAKVPTAGDLDMDLDTDIDDLHSLAADWLDSTWTEVQSDAVLEDMESYTADPNTYNGYWVGTDSDEYGTIDLSITDDPGDPNNPESLYGQVMQLDYDFDGEDYCKVTLLLQDRRANLSLYDQFTLRIRKTDGCDVSKILMDFYDGRENVDPVEEGMYKIVRFTWDISSSEEDEWVTGTGTFSDSVAYDVATDLYKMDFFLAAGDTDTGSLLIDSVWLADATEDCVLTAGEKMSDITGDCDVNLLDFAELAESWLNGE